MTRPLRYHAIVVGLLMIVLSGRLAFDISVGDLNIPITGQSLVVLLIGYYARAPEIILIFTVYLLSGALGLPVFAGGAGGVEHLFGKSGGYLYSFPVAAILVSRLRHSYRSATARLLLFLLATTLILLVGMFHLSSFIGLSKAFTYGVSPYIAGGIVKCCLALAITSIVGKIVDWY